MTMQSIIFLVAVLALAWIPTHCSGQARRPRYLRGSRRSRGSFSKGNGSSKFSVQNSDSWEEVYSTAAEWEKVASSGTGTYLLAASSGRGLMMSSTSGASWTEAAPVFLPQFIRAVAISSSGQYMLAGAGCGALYYSINFGVDWTVATSAPTSGCWTSASFQATGQIAVAVGEDIQAYISTNYGESWSVLPNSPEALWSHVSISPNSTYIAGTIYEYGIVVSPNLGASWVLAADSTADWASVAVSATGEFMYAVVYEGMIYQSSSYGGSFTNVFSPQVGYWTDITCSQNGQIVAASDFYSSIYLSTNFGVSWYVSSSPSSYEWSSIASDSGGDRFLASVYEGGLYIGTLTLTPSMAPNMQPTVSPTQTPSFPPSAVPSYSPSLPAGSSASPTVIPSMAPSLAPSAVAPSAAPTTAFLTSSPSAYPSAAPTTAVLTSSPSAYPSAAPTTAVLTSSPSAYPSAAPTTAVLTSSPSAYPSAASLTAFPSQLPSLTPSLAPSELPSVSPSFLPSQTPSAVPSIPSLESYAPTISFAPSQLPSTAPSPFPTQAPTTVLPTQSPSLSPTLSPSRHPTFQPTLAASYVFYLANITVSNITSDYLDASAQSALTVTTAQCSGLPTYDVQYVSSTVVNSSESNAAALQETSLYYTMLVTMQFTVACSDQIQAEDYFSIYSSVLADDIESGIFTGILHYQSMIYNAAATLEADGTNVSFSSEVFISTNPTISPTAAPVVSSDHDLTHAERLLVELAVSLPGLFIVLIVIAALLLRNKCSHALNELNSFLSEAIDAVVKGIITYLTISLLVSYAESSSSIGAMLSFVLLLLSRAWIVFLWLLVTALILRPTKSYARDRGESNAGDERETSLSSVTRSVSTRTGPRLYLALLLYKGALQTKLEITVYSMLVTISVLDISLLRLLPWIRTDLTHAMQAYPSLLTMRCCMYGTSMSHLMQAIAMVIRIVVANGDQSTLQQQKTYLLLAFTMFNVLRSFITVLMSMQVVSTQKAKLVVVNEQDVNALADFMVASRSHRVNLSLDHSHGDSRGSANGSVGGGASSKKLLTPREIQELLAQGNRSISNSGETGEGNQTAHGDVPSSPPLLPPQGGEREGAPPSADTHAGSATEDHSAPEQGTYSLQIPPPPPPPRDSFSDISVLTEDTDMQQLQQSPPSSSSPIPGTVVDDRGLRFSTTLPFADETVEVLRWQLQKAGKIPAQFMPLDQLQAEIAIIFSLANQGLPFDETRLDFLLMCLDYNPEYRLKKEEETQRWRVENEPFLRECLEIMRSFVPPHIFRASVQSLTLQDGFSASLAKRLLNKKCLWLVRLSTADISRLHIAELTGRFNAEGQGLDLVEAAGIFACLPTSFPMDSEGRKERWRGSLEQQVKDMLSQAKSGTLSQQRRRHPVYKSQIPLFSDRESLYSMEIVSKPTVAGARESFRTLGSSRSEDSNDDPNGGDGEDGSRSAVQRTRKIFGESLARRASTGSAAKGGGGSISSSRREEGRGEAGEDGEGGKSMARASFAVIRPITETAQPMRERLNAVISRRLWGGKKTATAMTGERAEETVPGGLRPTITENPMLRPSETRRSVVRPSTIVDENL